jgi:protoporphyrinogen oxidase
MGCFVTGPNRTLVVGGGISGLFAARIAAEQGDDVVLIEQADVIGGLLRSHTISSGHTFDIGTHFLMQTRDPAANDLLFEDLTPDDCYRFSDSLKEGNYFNGVLNQESGSIDTRTLPPDIHARGLSEILNAVSDETEFANLEAYLNATYGPTFTQHVYRPAIQALTGMDLIDLHQTAHLTFLITRLIVLDSHASLEIKKSDHFDAKIAWAKNNDGQSNIEKLYPKSGGVGAWVSGLEDRCRKMGVEILTGQKVASFERADGCISKVFLEDGRVFPVDRLVWTVPPALFLRTAGVHFHSAPPKFRTVGIINFVFDKEFQTDRHFICCYDREMIPFRITLYPNIPVGSRLPPPHHLTVEVLTDSDDIESLVPRAAADLHTMGIVPANAKILYSGVSTVRPGWPIITNDFADNADKLLSLAQENGRNVIFAGRGKGANAHFMNEILEGVFTTLSS